MSKALIIGDFHGLYGNLFTHVKMCEERGIEFDFIIQVGDFGVYPGNMKPLLLWCKKLGKPLHFIAGNHEDHGYLNQSYKKWIPFGLIYHPPGDILKIDGRTIGFCGGAYNVDRPQELWESHNHKHHALDGLYKSEFKNKIFAQNFPNEKEIAYCIKQFNENPLDLLVTHSCPANIGVGMTGKEIFKDTIKLFVQNEIDPRIQVDVDVGDFFLTDLWNGLIKKPSLWSYGHFHKTVISKVGITEFLCCGYSWSIDDMWKTQPIIIYDTETNKILL